MTAGGEIEKIEKSELTGSETILIAEDENAVRSFLRDTLETFGYKVICAEDGEDAILKFKENEGAIISLVILDVIMPKKNGKEAYHAIKETNPEIKALFLSGYTNDVLTSKGIF